MKLMIVIALCLPVPTWAAAFALSKHLHKSTDEIRGGVVREIKMPVEDLEDEEEAVEETEDDEYSDPRLDVYEPVNEEEGR